MDSKAFGQFIAGTRKERNMTQADLARVIGVTDKAISRWERGIGFPDINTLEPLAAALGISIIELMRSEKMDMENGERHLEESEVARIMESAVEMARKNQKQDRASVWIGGIVLIAAAALAKVSGHASIGGGIIVGTAAALLAVGMYLFSRNREDKEGRRIYGAFMLGGLSGLISLLSLMGVDSYMVTWGVYCVLAIFIVISGR